MPSKNAIKNYVERGIYHVYNRGVNKQKIYHEQKDYKRFMRSLNRCLSANVDNKIKNYNKLIKLFAFCLMPTHFHLLLRQTSDRVISEFMQSLTLSHSMYLSTKRSSIKRGRLLQDRYKARLITTEEDYLNTLNYIHNNPVELGYEPNEYIYSSSTYYENNIDLEFLVKDSPW